MFYNIIIYLVMCTYNKYWLNQSLRATIKISIIVLVGLSIDWTSAAFPVRTSAARPVGRFRSPVGAFGLQELGSHNRLLGMHLVHHEAFIYLITATNSNLHQKWMDKEKYIAELVCKLLAVKLGN